MQKKKDRILEKIVKKDYNNNLEEVLLTKKYSENAKSLLLSMLYKIEASYPDYKKVKRNVEKKEEYIENIINIIKNNCDLIEVINPSDDKSKELGKGTFIINQNKKKIKCYPIERKLLYAISKIKNDNELVDNQYSFINKPLSDLFNIGHNINFVEPIRDFNGYSWTTITKEIESVEYNLIYQNLRILLGYQLLNRFIYKKDGDVDYIEIIEKHIAKNYGEKYAKEILNTIIALSIVLAWRYNPSDKIMLKKELKEVEEQITKMNNKEEFIIYMTKRKRSINNTIRKIDTIINDKNLLKKEYEKRNANMPLNKKIFSMKYLTEIMLQEREKELAKIETLNKLLIPKNYVEYKNELKEKLKYLKLIKSESIEVDIQKLLFKLQKLFLECFEIKILNVENRNEIIDLIYQFRYYYNLPFNRNFSIKQINSLNKKIDDIQNTMLIIAKKEKAINNCTNIPLMNKCIFELMLSLDIINFENLYIKLTKEKEKIYIQIFDEEITGEKRELGTIKNLDKKKTGIKFNKKIKFLV